MRQVARTVLWVIVVVAVGTSSFVGGWYAHPATSPGPTSLGIIAAGTLAPSPLLPSLASRYANVTPGVSAPISAQLYEGSTAAATTIAAEGSNSPYDVFLSADFRVIPQRLVNVTPAYASGEAVFASDPVVLAYDPAALSGINSTNWAERVVAPGILLGVPNASADPLGANAIFAIELEDELTHSGGELYAHFFSGPMGGFASPTSHARYVTENAAATALATGVVQAYLIYATYARAEGLSYISLDPRVDLGGFRASDAANYGNASTTVLSGGSTTVISGAPVLFALTVPTNAPSTAVGDAFAAWLLSNSTAPAWAAVGFVLTPTVWVVGSVGFLPGGQPGLPPYLAALL